MPFPPRRRFTVPLPSGGALGLGDRPLLMGIVNVTPDSFAGGISDPAAAVDLALAMERDGADIVDVGGESTRPGADPIGVADELARVMPVVRGLSGRLRIPISIDTQKAEVARAALHEGVSIVNDVSGLRTDADLARVAAAGGAALILMHMRGTPKTMADLAVYSDLIGEITGELSASLTLAEELGVPPDRLLIDPGIGFAKRAPHSYGVLAGLADLAAALERPLVVGASRKSFLREASGGRPAGERDWGTAAAVTAAVLAGAHVVRVHAVAEMLQVVRTAERIREAGVPAARVD